MGLGLSFSTRLSIPKGPKIRKRKPRVRASITTLPVIGVPVKSRNSIDGWDSVLSILQMPGGIPVATVALDGAKNAGILAAEIIGSTDDTVAHKLQEYKDELRDKVMATVKELEK